MFLFFAYFSINSLWTVPQCNCDAIHVIDYLSIS